MWLPPPLAFSPEDIPADPRDNSTWFAVVKVQSTMAVIPKAAASPRARRLAEFVSRNALVVERTSLGRNEDAAQSSTRLRCGYGRLPMQVHPCFALPRQGRGVASQNCESESGCRAYGISLRLKARRRRVEWRRVHGRSLRRVSARNEAMIYRIGGAVWMSISAAGNQIVSEGRNEDCPLLRSHVIEITTRAAKFLS
jgi:hypothetical protein